MPDKPQLTELAWQTRKLIDEQQEKFPIGQIAIMNIMICISRFVEERGEAAGVSLITACLNAVMNGQQEIDVTNVPGFRPEPDHEVIFEMEEQLLKEDNVIFLDFDTKDEN